MDNSERLEEIVAGCRRGSNEAFSQLVDIYAKRCYGYFYRLTGNAEISNDLLSELFLKLVEKIGSFKGSSFENWLFTIAANIFRDYLRYRYRQKRMLEAKAGEIEGEKMPAKADAEIIDKLQVQLSRLDSETAELLMRRFYGQLSFKELAAMRSEPVGTTLSKVHRELKKLKKLMEQDDG